MSLKCQTPVHSGPLLPHTTWSVFSLLLYIKVRPRMALYVLHKLLEAKEYFPCDEKTNIPLTIHSSKAIFVNTRLYKHMVVGLKS